MRHAFGFVAAFALVLGVSAMSDVSGQTRPTGADAKKFIGSWRLVETTADGKFTLLTMECLGSCDTAPVALFGETLHENLTVAKLDALLDEAVANVSGSH